MAELEWTTEEPTKPGVYVFRLTPDEQGDVIRVLVDAHGVYRRAGRESAHFWRPGYWYGPLPEVKT